MCTAVIFLIPRTGANGTLKPCWKGRSIPNAQFAVLKRQTQLPRTDEDIKKNNRLSVPGTKRACQVGRHEPSPSAAPRRLDRGDVDFAHSHHRLESALCFIAAGRKRVAQHARRDLPG